MRIENIREVKTRFSRYVKELKKQFSTSDVRLAFFYFLELNATGG